MNECFYFCCLFMLYIFYSIVYKKYVNVMVLKHTINNELYYELEKHEVIPLLIVRKTRPEKQNPGQVLRKPLLLPCPENHSNLQKNPGRPFRPQKFEIFPDEGIVS